MERNTTERLAITGALATPSGSSSQPSGWPVYGESVTARPWEPATIKRLTLQNAGSSFDVETVSKRVDVTIENLTVARWGVLRQ